MDALEREEEYLNEQYANGSLSKKEYREELQELYRNYRAQAEEAAEQAYHENSW